MNRDSLDANRDWIVGPYERGQATVDEALFIFRAFDQAGQPGVQTMVDVGAHRGSSLGRFARTGWRVLAFEPDPKNRAGLMDGAGAMENVHVDIRPVSDADGEIVTFYRSEESTGVSGLNPFLDSHKPVLTAPTVSLSAFLRGQAARHVDFLKIDTEGHDLAVLRGFPWQRTRPLAVLTEFEDSKVGGRAQAAEMCAYLEDLGYSVFVSEWHPIVRYGISHDFRGVWKVPPGGSPDPTSWGNLLAVGEPLVEQLVDATKASITLRS